MNYETYCIIVDAAGRIFAFSMGFFCGVVLLVVGLRYRGVIL